MSAVLLDLPTEILVNILEDASLPLEKLFSLALLCRRLHFTALPVYFARTGLDAQSRSFKIVMRTDRRDLLAVLRLALFVPPFDNVTLVFPHPNCTSILPFLDHLKRAQGLIAQLPPLKRVELQLDVRGSICLSVGGDDALRLWAYHIQDLLSCILENECTALALAYGSQFTGAYELCPESEVTPVRRRASRLGQIGQFISSARRAAPVITQRGVHGFRRVYRQGDDHVEMSLPMRVSSSSRLTSLHIQSSILLLPPGLSWTLEALRSCPALSSLTFREIAVASNIWGIVFPLLASAATPPTRITSLFFRDVECIPEADIARFIANFPSLAQLEISVNVSQHAGSVPSTLVPCPQFFHLERLRATPNFIHHFLSRADSTFPALRELCIRCSAVYIGADITEIARLLSPIVATLEARQLGFPLTLAMESMGYMYHTAPPSPTLPATPGIGVQKCLDRVEGLEISMFQLDTSDIEDLVPWMEQFRQGLELAVAITPSNFLKAIEVNGRVYKLGGN
ncbi:hypothetical protein C8R43DRAFT_965136 [Mycena crocata]|nr:hypothetical protein C8R43DRAFT_965136 [Mycena crocata]